ncbi:unnamed protein product, partial [Meganyctiphanes norvegica]
MSDAEDSPTPPGVSNSAGGRGWYGSLEGSILSNKSSPSGPNGTQSSNNIHTSNEYMELDEPEMLDEKKALLEEFERKRRARMIHVTTDDSEVKEQLRQLCEPICLFGEGPADRRNRLKDHLSRVGEDALKSSYPGESGKRMEKHDNEVEPGVRPEETWYHEGPTTLKDARMYLVKYSLPRTKARLKKERIEKSVPEPTITAKKQEMQSKLRSFQMVGSQNAHTRPVSYVSFSPDGSYLATSSWSGVCKTWKVPECKEEQVLRGHDCYVDCIEWHPEATLSMEASALNLVSSGRDGSVQLWSLSSDQPLGELPKLESRVSRVKFHPSGRFLGACVHDNSWRLWDLEIQEEVLFQEGHSKPVYCIAFQGDGSLAATGGMDAYGRVWDLRTGRCVMFLTGHQNPVLCADWSPQGYHLVTGSEDNTVKIGQHKDIYSFPSANASVIARLNYVSIKSSYLLSCRNYFRSVRLWCHGSFQPLRSLEGHGQKVMAVDVNMHTEVIATCSFDRTFKLWGPD